jgi:ArsR family transcriptional regulator
VFIILKGDEMLEQKIGIFKALGEEVRLRIFALLLLQGELCVCDLENALNMSQPRISQHLLKLKNAELINDKKVGKWKHYYISKIGQKFIAESIFDLISSLDKNKIIKSDLKNLKKHKSQKC